MDYYIKNSSLYGPCNWHCGAGGTCWHTSLSLSLTPGNNLSRFSQHHSGGGQWSATLYSSQLRAVLGVECFYLSLSGLIPLHFLSIIAIFSSSINQSTNLSQIKISGFRGGRRWRTRTGVRAGVMHGRHGEGEGHYCWDLFGFLG